jgi:hypothetical protein
MTLRRTEHQSRGYAPRWRRIQQARTWLGDKARQARTGLPLLARREATRHMALSAVIMALSFRAMARLAPHAPDWATTADTVWATIDQPVRNYIACVRVVNGQLP